MIADCWSNCIVCKLKILCTVYSVHSANLDPIDPRGEGYYQPMCNFLLHTIRQGI